VVVRQWWKDVSFDALTLLLGSWLAHVMQNLHHGSVLLLILTCILLC
jgi:hypothetical protein